MKYSLFHSDCLISGEPKGNVKESLDGVNLKTNVKTAIGIFFKKFYKFFNKFDKEDKVELQNKTPAGSGMVVPAKTDLRDVVTSVSIDVGHCWAVPSSPVSTRNLMETVYAIEPSRPRGLPYMDLNLMPNLYGEPAVLPPQIILGSMRDKGQFYKLEDSIDPRPVCRPGPPPLSVKARKNYLTFLFSFMKAFIEESKESTQSRAEKGGAKCRDKATEDSDFLLANRAQYKRMELNLPLKKDICLTQAFRSHFLLKEDRKKLKVEKEGSDVYEQNEPQIEKADQGELQLQLSIGVLRWERKFRGKPAISDLGWPFTPSHKSSPYFATYVGSVLQGLLELSSTCSWLDRSVSGQIGRTRRFHLWKAPTPNGLSRCSHFLADPSCKRCTFSRREEGKLSSRSLLVFPSSRKRMKPGEKEMNTLLRNEASSLFFFKAPIRSRSPLLTGSRLISLPLATQMFQFAKFEKSKERRLATELGYGFPIGDPWITDGISPWPFASESVLPSQCPGIHPMHSFRSCTHGSVH
ncbi:hypothetical protein Tco_0516656 [Tanacetum coccineum]